MKPLKWEARRQYPKPYNLVAIKANLVTLQQKMSSHFLTAEAPIEASLGHAASRVPTLEQFAAFSISNFNYALPAHQLPFYHTLFSSFLQQCLELCSKGALASGEEIGSTIGTEIPINSSQDRSKSAAAADQSLNPADELKKSSAEEEDHARSCKSSKIAREFTLLLPKTCSPASNPHGAWTLRCNLAMESEETTHQSLPLRGKRIVFKDNIPIRGLPMHCGTPFAFIPHADSPLVSRCLDAGASIVGKAQCEYMCLSGASHTASAGLVRNAIAPEYHAGGSSSGCAVLVATGEADLSIGCDQGGSCRIPSAMNGVVGCKPTQGLVPYTLIDGMYGPIDHAGPITRTVEDNALMLGVLAGWDGADQRASTAARQRENVNYCCDLKRGVEGMRIAVLKEGFPEGIMEEDVAAATRDTAKLLEELGAEVEEISVPLHSESGVVWAFYVLPRTIEELFHCGAKAELLGVDETGKEWDRRTFLREKLLTNVASWSVSFRMAVMVGEWLRQCHPEVVEAGEEHRKRLIACYEAVLAKHDVLLMPTVLKKAKKLPMHLGTAAQYESASAELVEEHFGLAAGMSTNTSAFNLTGHPALCLPVGSGVTSNAEQQATALPLSVMLVGNYFQEPTLYRVAYAMQQACSWPSLLYNGPSKIDTFPS